MRSWLQVVEDAAPESPSRLLLSVLVVLSIWLLRRLLFAAAERLEGDAAARYRWRKLSTYATTLLAMVMLGLVWFERFQSITTFLGLVSAGLAIALKDLVVGFAGWIFLLVRKPFDLGDRIELGGLRGDVIDIRLFKFTLMEVGNWVAADQSTGRVIHVPNGKVLTDVLFNYSRGFQYLWHEIPVLVTFESNWKKAKKILSEIAEEIQPELSDEAAAALKRASSRYMLYYNRLTPIVYTSIEDSGVLLTIRHLSPPRGRRTLTESISEAILERFAEHDDIDLAYPTQRFYDNRREGKSRAGGVPAEPGGNGC
ncbi:MAG: mechanosensitive ion channel family protein [Acidobacteria bacterium]|nr:mechanosensitive ion channel family protein [Acidobacteriota bacterium]